MEFLKERKYLILMIVLWLGMIIDPLLGDFAFRLLFATISQTLTILTGLFLLDFSKRVRGLALGVGSLAILTSWLIRFWMVTKPLQLLNVLLYVVFFVLVVGHILKTLLHVREVGSGNIFAAITAYLLMGLLGASLATLLEISQPNSFQYVLAQGEMDFEVFTYYSFVTLTTLGYGDIIPISAAAKVLSTTLSLVGQTYLTIVVALLVGKYVKYND